MKATVTTLAAVLAITLGAAATQATQQTTQAPPATPAQATDQQKTPPEVTLTGCVIQGSTPTVFILDNAKVDPASTTEKGVRYILAKKDDDIDLRTHLNKSVRITGEVDAKVMADPAPPTTPPVPADPEKNLPKLKAKSVTMVSDTCPTLMR